MTDYNLSRLSSRSFEHLVQALAARVLGPGIVVFGDGRDGGREATFERKVPYPTAVDGWEGYGVVQAKYRQRPRDVQQDGNWAVNQLKEEIGKYYDPKSELRKPDFFVFATNVVLTPVRDVGSKDRAIATLEEFKSQSPLRDYAIWDYDQICTFLDAYEDVRKAYAAFITPDDVLAEVISLLRPSPADMYETFVRFLEKELLNDECVKLEQAGHNVDDRIPLATVFVDLPAHDELSAVRAHILEDEDFNTDYDDASTHLEGGFIGEIVDASSELFDPKSSGALLMSSSHDPSVPRNSRGRFVLIGGPGQGKTTLTQFICQIFRTSIISGRPEHTLSPEIKSALLTIQEHCDLENINYAVVPRFPFKIVLNDFAIALARDSPYRVNSVLGYLSRQIKDRTDTNISADDLRRFLSVYPSVLIFDGLDEVPASSNRDQVLRAIRDFWVDASNANADILSIATSRPQGYNEDFSPSFYQHRQLAELSYQLGWRYAQRLAEMRYRTDEDRKRTVLTRLGRAFRDVSTARLMRSPLQVTIMAALVDRIGQPPQVRWSLFNQYYEVIYDREVERSIPASNILRDFKPDIKAIHNQVGLILQIDSEQTGRTDAKLSRERFIGLVESRLATEGHTGNRLHQLAQQIVEAASHRLVFLVELEAEQVGFEIRSLQEFMAAECLMDGIDQNIRARLDEIAPIPFWRNVFLFAAGKCFAQHQALREPVRDICAELNDTDSDTVASTFLVGSDLAIALIEEGSSRNQPRFENLLARFAMRILDTANPELQIKLADLYESQLENIYQDEIRLRLTSSNRVQVFGAWNCLLRLAAADIPWAIRMATDEWPADQDDQVDILLSVHEPAKNPWAAEKLRQLIPNTDAQTFADVLRQELPGRWFEGRDTAPEIQLAMSTLEMAYSNSSLVNVLDTGLSYGGIGSLKGKESEILLQHRHIQQWHPSWDAYKYAGEFMHAPSKESLAGALKALAGLFRTREYMLRFPRYSNMPWPILACLYHCKNSEELLQLADEVKKGALGDVDDWIAAETRWFEKGITRHDMLSMTDDRLPFDARIGETGFPPTIPVLAAIIGGTGSEESLQDILDIFDSLSPGKTRSFVATTINWSFLAHSFEDGPYEVSTIPTIEFQKLVSIYHDVPSGSLIPLHMVVNLIGDSIQRLSEFFKAFSHKNFVLHSESPRRTLHSRKSVRILRRAYMALDDDDLLLPVLGVLAENGHLADQYIDVKSPKSLRTDEGKLAALIVNLCQESWQSDSSEEFIESIKEIEDSSGNVINRILHTLENSKPIGENLDNFLVALGALNSSGQFRVRRRYMNLLQDILRRRTSQFAELSESARFSLPVGVLESLSK